MEKGSGFHFTLWVVPDSVSRGYQQPINHGQDVRQGLVDLAPDVAHGRRAPVAAGGNIVDYVREAI